MHESADELTEVQRLLGESRLRAGSHLRSVISAGRVVDAPELSQLLTGAQLLFVSTLTASNQPRVAPVYGLFFNGKFHFGSAPNSVRFRHLKTGRRRARQ
jgi:Pyridoxamine 5'-phosphate oxidase